MSCPKSAEFRQRQTCKCMSSPKKKKVGEILAVSKGHDKPSRSARIFCEPEIKDGYPDTHCIRITVLRWSERLDSNYRDYLLSIQIHSLKPLFATVSGCPLRHPSTFTTIKNQALKGKIREKGKTKPPSQMHLPAFPFPLKRPLLKMHFQKLSFLYPVWAPE